MEFLREVGPPGVEVDGATDLIEGRVIDSLQFVQFIFFIEELTGQVLDPEQVSVDDFRTLDAIELRFFGGVPA